MEELNRSPRLAANWDHWADIPIAELWEAVALSLNFEPKLLPGHQVALRYGGGFFDACPEVFRQRLDKAERCVEGGTLKTYSFINGCATWVFEVQLQDFRAWAESLHKPWPMPKEFPRYAAPVIPPAQPTLAPQAAYGVARAEGAPLPIPGSEPEHAASPFAAAQIWPVQKRQPIEPAHPIDYIHTLFLQHGEKVFPLDSVTDLTARATFPHPKGRKFDESISEDIAVLQIMKHLHQTRLQDAIKDGSVVPYVGDVFVPAPGYWNLAPDAGLVLPLGEFRKFADLLLIEVRHVDAQVLPLPTVSPSEAVLAPALPATPPAVTVADDGGRRVKPPQVFPAQEAEILKTIRKLGHEPKRLPPRPPGKPWVKSDVWREIGVCQLFATERVFDKAWDRLRTLAEIAERRGL